MRNETSNTNDHLNSDDAKLRLSEDDLWKWCQELCDEADREDWAIDGLILLLWNVANQADWLDCKDMADRLIERLYTLTSDCQEQKRNYLQMLPGKNYRAEEPPAAAPLAAVA